MANTLEMDIIFGRLPPRERLIEDELMARFAKSRHYVRSAIDTVVQHGLAVREINKGAYVCDFTHDDVIALYQLRNILHEAALSLIIFPVEPQIIARLEALNTAHVAAVARSDLQDVFHLNNLFHAAVFLCCPNRALADAIDVHAHRMYPIGTNSFHREGYLMQAQQEHRQIIDALVRGDIAALISLHERHIARPVNDYLEKHGMKGFPPVPNRAYLP